MTSNDSQNSKRLNVAVIGSGISGLGAAWLLSKKHDVSIFEKNSYLGGHSNTVFAQDRDDLIPIDTGFIVYNEANYPNLSALFEHLSVPTEISEMSFAASLENGNFEYSGTSLNGLLGQRKNIFRKRFWKMIVGILKFYKEAPKFLKREGDPWITLEQFLTQNNYDCGFVDDHLLPMGAAIWSTTDEEIKSYPAHAFIRFFQSHGLLNIMKRPEWRTVSGGSVEYIKRLTRQFKGQVIFDTAVSVQRSEDNVTIITQNGEATVFDHVIIATHADDALSLLETPSTIEDQVLSPWQYTKNQAVLHTEEACMPRERRTWSSWNFLDDGKTTDPNKFCVTYWMNKLQNLSTKNQYFVTLNPKNYIEPKQIISEQEYTHPYFDRAALKSQKNLWSIQGKNRTWYCGSYFGYGFHEDGLQSGLAVAEQLGNVKRPWNVSGENNRLTLPNLNKEFP